jgi:hypothetical protein
MGSTAVAYTAGIDLAATATIQKSEAGWHNPSWQLRLQRLPEDVVIQAIPVDGWSRFDSNGAASRPEVLRHTLR